MQDSKILEISEGEIIEFDKLEMVKMLNHKRFQTISRVTIKYHVFQTFLQPG